MGANNGKVSYFDDYKYPWKEEAFKPIQETFTKEDVREIIHETIAEVFERERMWREYDRLTAEWDRRNKK